LARQSVRFAPRATSGLVVACLAAAALLLGAGTALAASPQQDVADANAFVQRALTAARASDLTTARHVYDQYENTWFEIEDGVRATSRDAYVSIEKAMTGVTTALRTEPPNANDVANALATLDREQQAFVQGQAWPPTDAAGAASASSVPTIATLLDTLESARAALNGGDYATAVARLKTFESDWLTIEGQVKTRSVDDYRQTETDTALAESLAAQGSSKAGDVVDRMAGRLQPYVQPTSYGIFDAAIILLREGLEALLVIVALSAFLKKSGNRAGEGWLWSGAAAGLLLSIMLGVGIQAFFGAIINPANREIMEGLIGLVAAAMLIYVSYWLHSKASLSGWQRYISARTDQALRGGRLFGLAALAFLAVFREGAETALFYLGMVSNISNTDLIIGLGLGFVGLALLGFLMVVVGVRIPLRPFFSVASVLVFYLCFKFVGTGIHALQVAGIVPGGSAVFLPSLDAVGVYPTWPTTVAQVLLLAAALWVLLHDRIGGGARRSAAVLVGSSQ
jgi:high-affinity iron transporter